MSKRHSYQSDRSSQDQYDDSDVDSATDADDPADGDDAADDDGLPKSPSLLGREAKIGLAVVFVLVVVLGAVLARRLTSPGADADKKSPTAAADKKAADSGQDAAKGQNSAAPKTTVLEPRPGSSRQAPAGDVGQWAVVSDSGTSTRSGTGSRTGASPSYMPSQGSGAAGSASRDPYAAARPAAKMGSPWQTGAAGTADTASSRPGYEPLRAHAATDSTGAGSRAAGSAGQADATAPAYTPAASVQPTRTTSPFDAGTSTAPADGNPLRGQAGTAITIDPGTSGSRDPAGASASSGYRAGAYGQATTGQYGQTGQYGPSGAATTAQSPATLPGGTVQTPLGTSDAASAPAKYGSTAPSSTRYGGTQYGTGASGPLYVAGTGQTGAGSPGASPFVTQHGAGAQRRADGSYVVQPGDTYWTISERLYGTGAYFKALAEHNRAKVPQPDRLAVGDVIAAPAKEQLEQNYADLCPKAAHVDAARRQAMSLASGPAQYGAGRTYVVQEGDTLWDIAKYELGKPARWLEVYELNKEVLGEDLDHLRPGTRLALPGGETPDTLTRRPGTGMQR